jgi:CheY-like chemotaxis protein
MARTILLIDDSVEELRVLVTYLKSADYRLILSNNGADGIQRAIAFNPDLILLDIRMPKMDGFAVCKELQDPRWSKYRDIPILILTSVREEASRRRYELETGLELNVADYVEKPMSPDVLLKRVSTLIKKKPDSV